MSKELNPVDGMTVVLEDRGQDFLEFDIKDGRVIDARPFQADIWSDQPVLNEAIAVGDHIALRADWGTRTLLYPVVGVLPLRAPASTSEA